jgi:hypothetical protein
VKYFLFVAFDVFEGFERRGFECTGGFFEFFQSDTIIIFTCDAFATVHTREGIKEVGVKDKIGDCDTKLTLGDVIFIS